MLLDHRNGLDVDDGPPPRGGGAAASDGDREEEGGGGGGGDEWYDGEWHGDDGGDIIDLDLDGLGEASMA